MSTHVILTCWFHSKGRASTAEVVFAVPWMYGVCSRANKRKSRSSCGGTLRLELSVTHRKCCQIQPHCKHLQLKVYLFSNELAINDQLINF